MSPLVGSSSRHPLRIKPASFLAFLTLLAAPICSSSTLSSARAAEPPRDSTARDVGGRDEKVEQSMGMIEVLRGYLELIERYDRIAKDPSASGVAAVLMAEEILKGRSSDEAITYYTRLLPDVKNEAVQRAIRVQLADLYKNTGQPDKALEQLRILMTSAPPEPQPATPPQPAGVRWPAPAQVAPVALQPAPPQPAREVNDAAGAAQPARPEPRR